MAEHRSRCQINCRLFGGAEYIGGILRTHLKNF